MRITLTPGDLRNILAFFKVVRQLLDKAFLSQECLTPDLVPHCLLSNTQGYELPVPLSRFASFPVKLAEHPVCCQAGMGFYPSCCGKVTGECIVLGLRNHFCTNRIEHNISAHFKKVAVLLDQDGLVPALKYMACFSMPFIKALRIEAVQLAHADGEISVRGFDEEMIVVGHEAVGVTKPMVTFIHMLKGMEKVVAVLIILEYRLFIVAP